MASEMGEREETLRTLRNRRNQARKQNKSEVLAEITGEKLSRAEGHEEYVAERRAKERVVEEEATPEEQARRREREKRLNTTALDVEWERGKKSKRAKHVNATWDMHNADSKYKSYKKRLHVLDKLLAEAGLKDSKKQQQDDGEDELAYGETREVEKVRLDILIKELKAKDERKKNFSRRRAEYDDEDVSHINDANRVFVKKLERAFGSYTAETKNNLEKGTA